MRILHTSDWHLGRSLHGVDLIPFQATFLDDLVAAVDLHRVDVVVVAGDIFDKGIPPVAAVSLLGNALVRLADRCDVVVTSGNHDSAIRLGAGATLYRDGVHVATDPADVGNGIDVTDAEGVRVRIYPIPYLDPDFCRRLYASDGELLPRSHEAVMRAAVARIRDDIASVPESPAASIGIAHAFVVGAEPSESERDISVGGVDSIPASVFNGLNYVALGHLHRPQQLGSDSTLLRYSGSPLRYSFSEATSQKSFVLVDVDANGHIDCTTVPIPQPRPMVTLSGLLADIVSPENHEAHSNAWVRAIVTDVARPPELMDAIRAVFPHTLTVIHRPTVDVTANTDLARNVDVRDPITVSGNFLRDVTSIDATPSELLVLRDAYDAAKSRSS